MGFFLELVVVVVLVGGGGALCAQAVTEGARTAVSGSLKRFSQAEIFNLLRENKAEKKQRTKRS